jgi:hypothetical protein
MTAKYIAEHLGRGDLGVVRAIFFKSLRLQIVLSAVTTSAGLLILFIWGDPQ